MESTLDLLEAALKAKPSQAALAREIGVTPSTLSDARTIGHLPAIVAGQIALTQGEDPFFWMGQATLEGAKDSPAKRSLQKALRNWRKRSVSIIREKMTRACARGKRSASLWNRATQPGRRSRPAYTAH